MDLSKTEDYQRLAELLNARGADSVVMYVATAPSLFTNVCEQIAAVGLNGPTTRVVLEKPLGHDLQSNQAINDTLRRVLKEEQVFRIDHYLGKPSVQNLFALRFGNALFEPLWRRETIANIQITIAEELGVARGAFYDQTGALRDMVQNHALQLLCAIGMEPPSTPAPTPFATKSSRCCSRSSPGRWRPSASMSSAASTRQVPPGPGRARIRAGKRRGPRQHHETFVALRTEILNWRWAGVPSTFAPASGWRARRAHRHQLPPCAAPDFQDALGAANRLVINLQPKDGLELHLMAQGAAQHQTEPALAGAPEPGL
jgi:glucose-6-phosphate 1-dehydrogenase